MKRIGVLFSILLLFVPLTAIAQDFCEGSFDYDLDVDGTDAFTFKTDFGRSKLLNPCTNALPCKGDFDCDGDVDGTDAKKFKEDFGRSSLSDYPCQISNPETVWCLYNCGDGICDPEETNENCFEDCPEGVLTIQTLRGTYNLGESVFLRRVFLAAMLIMFTAAFVLSYSRAAWLSMIVSFVLAAVLLLRISWKLIIPAIAVISIVAISSWSSLIIKIGDIRQESSGEIPEQIRSVANITTDVSNLERINRWKSAIRMSSEKPLLGWGPGTYQFRYAPFQLSTEKTEISTNWGERGNAHSEYLGALAESGWPGMLLYIALVLTVIARG